MLTFFNIGSILLFIYFAFVIVLTIQIVLDNKPPEVAVAWLLAIYFLPYFGAGLFLLSGVNWKKRKIMKQLPERSFKTYLGPVLEQQKTFLQEAHTNNELDMIWSKPLA